MVAAGVPGRIEYWKVNAEAEVGQFAPIEEMNYDFQAEEVGSGQHVLAVAAKKAPAKKPAAKKAEK